MTREKGDPCRALVGPCRALVRPFDGPVVSKPCSTYAKHLLVNLRVKVNSELSTVEQLTSELRKHNTQAIPWKFQNLETLQPRVQGSGVVILLGLRTRVVSRLHFSAILCIQPLSMEPCGILDALMMNCRRKLVDQVGKSAICCFGSLCHGPLKL